MREALILCLLPSLCQAQEPKLAYVRAFNGGAVGSAITTDNAGNIYTVGQFSGSCDFDPGPGTAILSAPTNHDDLFLTKLDPSGHFLWVKQFASNSCAGSVITDVEVDDDGNIFTTGYNACDIDFDPGSSQFIVQGSAIFITKHGPGGNIEWVRRVGGGTARQARDMVLVADAIVVVGTFQGTIDFDPGPSVFNMTTTGFRDAFILTLNQDGGFVNAWEFNQVGGSWEVLPFSVITNSANDIIIGGSFRGVADFDPSAGVNQLGSLGSADGFLCKLTNAGSLVWVNRLGGTGWDEVRGLAVDDEDNIYLTGDFESTVDMDPGPGTTTLVSAGGVDVWVACYSATGQLRWAGSAGGPGTGEYAYSLDRDPSGSIWVVGLFVGPSDFDFGTGTYLLQSAGTWGFVAQWDRIGRIVWAGPYGGTASRVRSRADNGVLITGEYAGNTFDMDPGPEELYLPGGAGAYVMALSDKGVRGGVWNDVLIDCVESFLEPRLDGRLIEVAPIGILSQTNSLGVWFVDSLPPGNYVARVDHGRGPWTTNCSPEQPFEIVGDERMTVVPPFGLVTTTPCAMPDVSIAAPTLRPCFSNQKVYVTACNQAAATSAMVSTYVEVQLDPLLQVTWSSHPYTVLDVSRYRLDIGDLFPGQCFNGVLQFTLDCSAILGQTLCLSAELFPVPACALDTIPGPGDCATVWDGSEIKVDSYCLNDTVHFTIRNVASPGVGDMVCYSMVRIFLDGVLLQVDSVQLAGGESSTFSFPGNGQTWRVEVDQHPLHPGNSRPNAVLERCGPTQNWTPRLVAAQYMDDSDPVIDRYCGEVTGAFDPNDKIGHPTGLTDSHFILPDEQLQYMIRFQNTGNDTAFTVIVRDTLDVSLDAFTLVPGVASHPSSFRMYGPRVVEWTFENILLPDSTTDSPGSNGFVTFRVNLMEDLPNWTVVHNVAAIYFDYNEPVLTAPCVHTVHDMADLTTSLVGASQVLDGILVYPNPSLDGRFSCEFPTGEAGVMTIFDSLGRPILRKQISTGQRTAVLDIASEPAGIYFIEHSTTERRATIRAVKY